MSEQKMDPSKNPIRRLTNAQLWRCMPEGSPLDDLQAVERELERRLRKIAFLPPLPPREDA